MWKGNLLCQDLIDKDIAATTRKLDAKSRPTPPPVAAGYDPPADGAALPALEGDGLSESFGDVDEPGEEHHEVDNN